MMTLNEAKEVFINRAFIPTDDGSGRIYDPEKWREACYVISKWLEQEPCEDAISRAEVIDELNRIGRNAFKEDTDYDNFFAFLDNLPPVTPRPKTGVLEQKTCVTMRNLSDKELKHFVEEMKKVRPQVIRQEPCTDAISRQAVIDVIERWLECSGYNEAERHIMRAVQSVLHELPPVTPQPKTGHWNSWFTEIKGNDTFNCMECGSTFIVEQGAHDMNYCPNCGCRMVEPQESEG